MFTFLVLAILMTVASGALTLAQMMFDDLTPSVQTWVNVLGTSGMIGWILFYGAWLLDVNIYEKWQMYDLALEEQKTQRHRLRSME